MKLFTLAALLAVLCGQSESQGILGSIGKGIGNVFGLNVPDKACEQNPLPIFYDVVSDFSIKLLKRAAYYSNGPFIVSPYMIWLSLGAISEFADKDDQTELFAALNLPEAKCIRQSLYHIALTIERRANDVRFNRDRALAIDEKVKVNRAWIEYADTSNILRYLSVPFDDATFQNVPITMGISSQIALGGHSIILDRLDFEGVWSTVFPEAYIERAPFYNDFGQEIATVEYLRMKSRVRLAHIPIINAKVLEIPLGLDGRYTMLLTMGVNNNTVKRILDLLMNSIIVDMMNALTLSLIPIDIAIPRFSLSAGFDARVILEDMGLGKVFSEPDITRHISNPPALPCGYLQKVSINITSGNLSPRQPESNAFSALLSLASNAATGLASAVGRDFIANRPFIFTLVETRNRVTVFTGVYSFEEGRKADRDPNKMF